MVPIAPQAPDAQAAALPTGGLTALRGAGGRRAGTVDLNRLPHPLEALLDLRN
jgi:hypothetical protein